jgi:DNA mismatch repair ATPase MutL
MVDAYDVNVSPDKRTILLHDQGALLESLKVCEHLNEPCKADLRRHPLLSYSNNNNKPFPSQLNICNDLRLPSRDWLTLINPVPKWGPRRL